MNRPQCAVLPLSNPTMQSNPLSVAGPKIWNELPSALQHLQNGACFQFCQQYCWTLIFLLGMGRECLWVRIIKGCYINYDSLMSSISKWYMYSSFSVQHGTCQPSALKRHFYMFKRWSITDHLVIPKQWKEFQEVVFLTMTAFRQTLYKTVGFQACWSGSKYCIN